MVNNANRDVIRPKFTSKASTNIAEWGKVYLDENSSLFSEVEQDNLRTIKNNLQGWDKGNKISSWELRFKAAEKSIKELYDNASNKDSAQHAVDQLFKGIFDKDSYYLKKQEKDPQFKKQITTLEDILLHKNKPEFTNRATLNVEKWSEKHLDNTNSPFTINERADLETLRDNLRGVDGKHKLRTWEERFERAKQSLDHLYNTSGDMQTTKGAVKELFEGIFEHSEYYKTKQELDLTFKRKVNNWKRYIDFGIRDVPLEKKENIYRERKQLTINSSAQRDSLVLTYKALTPKTIDTNRKKDSPNDEVFRAEPSEFEIVEPKEIVPEHKIPEKKIDDRVFELLYQAKTKNGKKEHTTDKLTSIMGERIKKDNDQETESFIRDLVTITQELYKHPKSEWREIRAQQLYRARIIYGGEKDPISKKGVETKTTQENNFQRIAPIAKTKIKNYSQGSDIMQRNAPIATPKKQSKSPDKTNYFFGKTVLTVATGLALTASAILTYNHITKKEKAESNQQEVASVEKPDLESKVDREKSSREYNNTYQEKEGKHQEKNEKIFFFEDSSEYTFEQRALLNQFILEAQSNGEVLVQNSNGEYLRQNLPSGHTSYVAKPKPQFGFDSFKEKESEEESPKKNDTLLKEEKKDSSNTKKESITKNLETTKEKSDRILKEMIENMKQRKRETKTTQSEPIKKELTLGGRMGFTYTENPDRNHSGYSNQTRMNLISQGLLKPSAENKLEYISHMMRTDLETYVNNAAMGKESTVFNKNVVEKKIKQGHGFTKEFDLTTRLDNLFAVYIFSKNRTETVLPEWVKDAHINDRGLNPYITEVSNTLENIFDEFENEGISREKAKKKFLPQGEISTIKYALALSFSGRPAHEFSKYLNEILNENKEALYTKK